MGSGKSNYTLVEIICGLISSDNDDIEYADDYSVYGSNYTEINLDSVWINITNTTFHSSKLVVYSRFIQNSMNKFIHLFELT